MNVPGPQEGGAGPVESQVVAISPADLRTLLEGGAKGLRVVDVRRREAYDAGHLPGALHLHVHDLVRREGELPPRTSTIVVVGEPGRRSRGAAVFFVLAGFPSVAVLEGGFEAWEGPVEAG